MQVGQILHETVGQHGIGLAPDVFRWIEFRRVAGEMLHVQARMVFAPRENTGVSMNAGTIP